MRFLDRLRPEVVGPPDCPIMLRWTLIGRSGETNRLMLHWFPPNADDRDPHDHPCDFWTLVLQGGYDDLVPRAGRVVVGDRMRRGSLRFRAAEHTHRTCVGSGGCWSLVWMRPRRREWGFHRGGRFWKWFDYEHRFGFGMRCEPVERLGEKAKPLGQPLIEDPRRTDPYVRIGNSGAPVSVWERHGVPAEVIAKTLLHRWRNE